MNIFIRNIYKFFFYSLFSVFLIISCSDDKIVYNNLQEKKVNIIIDSEKQKEFEDSLIKTKILFNSNVSNFSVTTSTTLLSADRYVVIYSFNKYFNTYIAKYYSKTAGTLSPKAPFFSLFPALHTFYAYP